MKKTLLWASLIAVLAVMAFGVLGCTSSEGHRQVKVSEELEPPDKTP